jgi:hypothetical protein
MKKLLPLILIYSGVAIADDFPALKEGAMGNGYDGRGAVQCRKALRR